MELRPQVKAVALAAVGIGVITLLATTLADVEQVRKEVDTISVTRTQVVVTAMPTASPTATLAPTRSVRPFVPATTNVTPSSTVK